MTLRGHANQRVSTLIGVQSTRRSTLGKSSMATLRNFNGLASWRNAETAYNQLRAPLKILLFRASSI